jgi:hypothetical protein
MSDSIKKFAILLLFQTAGSFQDIVQQAGAAADHCPGFGIAGQASGAGTDGSACSRRAGSQREDGEQRGEAACHGISLSYARHSFRGRGRPDSDYIDPNHAHHRHIAAARIHRVIRFDISSTVNCSTA